MPDQLVVGDKIVDNDWTLVTYPVKDEPVRKQAGKPVLFKITGEPAATAAEIAALSIPAGKVIVPLSAWVARKDELSPRLADRSLGIWIDSFEPLETLVGSIDDLNRLAVIAVNFPRFPDGRGYSMATLLRMRHNYRGELRAIGDVLLDQLFYMRRVGFNAFAVRADKKIEEAMGRFKDFKEPYQGAVDQPLPSYRRHIRG